MSEDDAEQTEDETDRERNADEETVADVDHEHPTTGETFDRTGVHGRGRKRPDADDAEASEPNEDDSAGASEDDSAGASEDDPADGESEDG